MTFRIGYLVHDLNDAAVAKRCEMMLRGGAEVSLAGFHRASVPGTVTGLVPTDLGRTADGALAQRASAVMRNIALPKRARQSVEGADILVARNLETLAIAHRIAEGRPVIYECLDIHRSLLGGGLGGQAIRKIEAQLLTETRAIITSSPGFIREYFDKRPTGNAEIRLIENKILLAPGEIPQAPLLERTEDGPTWVIGWFGMLRCQRTLQELSELARKLDGLVKIQIAGKPSPAELPDFEEKVADAPYCSYSGPYSPVDLPRLYSSCHFAWTIDWFEEGQNSEWLLPNRLYEATAHATVPIVLKRHEVGRWLAEKSAGLQIVNTSELTQFFQELSPASYGEFVARVSQIDPDDIMMGDAQCREFVSWLKGQVA